METAQIGYLAAEHRIEIHELTLRRASLEAAFMELTQDSIDYQQTEPTKSVTARETAEALSGRDHANDD